MIHDTAEDKLLINAIILTLDVSTTIDLFLGTVE